MLGPANDLTPIAVLLVTKGTKEDRLLYIYPHPQIDTFGKSLSRAQKEQIADNPFAFITSDDDDNLNSESLGAHNKDRNSLIDEQGCLIFECGSVSWEDLYCWLFAVKPVHCDRKFEVKISDVRFVGYPVEGVIQANDGVPSHDSPQILTFQVLFALRASANRSVVESFNELSKRYAIAIKFEEKRSFYLSKQAKIMAECKEAQHCLPEGDRNNYSPYAAAANKSSLAQNLRETFDNICENGESHVFLNGWIHISFGLPQKMHLNVGIANVDIKKIEKYISLMRPYHSFLLLRETAELYQNLPLDSSPVLSLLLQCHSPFKSMQQLSAHCDLPLTQVFQLAAHLVYWARATIIYPIRFSNVYVISPTISCDQVSRSVGKLFEQTFPDTTSSLPVILAEFSIPTSLSDFTAEKMLPNPDPRQLERVRILIWLLQHRLLIQQFLFVYLIPPRESLLPDCSSGSVKQAQNALSSSRHKTVSESEVVRTADTPTDKEVNIAEKLWQEVEKFTSLPNQTAKLIHSAAVKCAIPVEKLVEFLDLCQYFDGTHHVEEISFCSQSNNCDVMELIDLFNCVLLTVNREDNLTYQLLSPD